MTTSTAAPGSTTAAITVAGVAAYRAAVRAPMAGSAAVDGPASPLHPFVLSTELFDRTVAGLCGTDAAGAEPPRPVHLGQDVLVSRLVRPGERVTVRLDVLGARREARGVRLALRAVVRDVADEPVARLATAVLLAGASAPEPFGDIPPPAGPAASATPVEETALSHQLTVDTIRRYAAASGDLNPIHLDPEAGRAAGFPGVIAHGMSVLALVCEEVVDRYAGGDPARVRGIGCRFSAPVLPDEPLRTTLRYDGAAVRFSCATPRGVALKGGWVELAPAGEVASDA